MLTRIHPKLLLNKFMKCSYFTKILFFCVHTNILKYLNPFCLAGPVRVYKQMQQKQFVNKFMKFANAFFIPFTC